MNKKPIILSIDTSCDDTSVAITRGLVVLSNVIASQTQLHKQYGGVFPTVAKQAHKDNIDPSIKAALKKANLSTGSRTTWQDIDAVAVTQGPGLAPALEVGINKAKKLAEKYDKKLIAVNHIEGHCLSPLAIKSSKSVIPAKAGIQRLSKHSVHGSRIKSGMTVTEYPILSLVISGGHSEFILIKNIGEYERLGFTIDDAAGECLDKVGRMLNLGYPAGRVIEKFAKKGDEKRFAFPLPMTESQDFNLSFSGLKTFARNKIEELETSNQLDKQAVYDFAASFQYAVFRHICHKLSKILKKYPHLGQVWLGGGVAANTKLRAMIRKTLRDSRPVKTQNLASIHASLSCPYSKKLCSDNAAMIGIVANFKYQQNKFVENINELERRPRLKIVI